MSDNTKLNGELRDDFGKGAARQARRAGKIPAVIYGHGAEPIHVLLPAQATTLAVRQSNALLTIVVDGEDHVALVKDIQRHALKMTVDHLDLLTVRRGEKVTVDVNVHVEGEVAPGAVFNLEYPTVSLEAEALNLPDSVTVNIEGREAGDNVLASDIQLPEGATLLLEADTVIATVAAPVEADLGGSEEGEASAEAPSEESAE
ncbi:50S ribosomal protein L25/general stress protein Ctc [Neomicrococcus aestuarii]|uniref:Large ribosomal subunit protein bL25 n=1 Tax=Neomicrococcus aestuarii TaxID=556325 RepID=A0A1L2ZMW4_9MICC|nr:50S ribosomal protein L25/general stress protein Ctc [Neomicrococcus aestuarii]APF40479.1 50S ribosomal protein L25/general stress protein Ctc [Neomicrococcus aestuarii]